MLIKVFNALDTQQGGEKKGKLGQAAVLQAMLWTTLIHYYHIWTDSIPKNRTWAVRQAMQGLGFNLTIEQLREHMKVQSHTTPRPHAAVSSFRSFVLSACHESQSAHPCATSFESSS
jgi:hypothetical protein